MKKITLCIMMLLGITAFSQVEIVENFNNTPDFDIPTGWSQTGDFIAKPFLQCGGTGKSASTGFEFLGTASLTTPNYSAATNATDLIVSFSINVFEQGPVFIFPVTYNAPVASWGTVTLEYSIDGGTIWNTAYTIDDTNFTYVGTETCVEIPATNLGVLAAGTDFQARFVVNAVNITPDSGNVLVVVVDNVSITQLAASAPNCDAALLHPTDGSTGANLDAILTWQAATGLATGYTVSIGTTSGGTDILNAATTATTSYPLAGLSLAYATEYFVNIVPFNSFGDATGCTEQSFTTRLQPVTGATCLNPFEITSFPFIQANQDTGNFENNINDGPCGNFPGAYMGGNDVFYTISPATDKSINISLATVSDFGAAIHVMDDCPDVATNCIALLGDDYSTTPPYNMELNDVVLLAGNTYFIVVSNAGLDSTFTYSLIITENSCINPSMSLTAVSDCETNEFTVDVDVTYLGSATSLTLTDNFGNSNNSISSTGIVNFGPYTSTSTVEFTLTNNQDVSCSYSDSTFYYCPPINDDCTDSIPLTINTDGTCTIFTSATNAGATEELATNPITCEFINNNDVWFSFVASNEILILEYLNVTAAIGSGGTIQATELLEGNCGSFTSIRCYSNNYVTLNNLTVGNTYYIRNSTRNSGEFAQNYDICLKEPPAPPANDACSNAITLTLSTDANCNNQLMGTTVGATPSAENTCNSGNSEYWKDVWYVFTAAETGFYEFSFERSGFDPGADYFIYSGACGTLVAESPYCFYTNNQVLNITSGESYYIMVRSADNGPGIDFSLCVFKLPPAASNDDCSTPTVLLESTDSNGDNMISGDFANSYPSSEACDVGGKTIWYSFTPSYTGTYYFNLINNVGFPYYSVFNTDDCSQTSNNYVLNSSCYGSGPLTTELVAGNTYLISVYSFSNSNIESFDLMAYPDPSLSVESNTFEYFTFYPNPVSNLLTVEARNTISAVSVYNIVGQKVQLLTPNSSKAVIDMERLDSGVYFVTVSSEGSQKTIKIIKK